MKAKLICYNLATLNGTDTTQVKRELLGYTDFSNQGRYKYERQGILDKILHLKPMRSVLIVNIKDVKKITEVLDRYNAKYYVSSVSLKQADSKMLRKKR